MKGQYVYINIPAISSLEWHPFTISSAPIDEITTHHIKVMGGINSNQWTAKLHRLAIAMSKNNENNDLNDNNDMEEQKSFLGDLKYTTSTTTSSLLTGSSSVNGYGNGSGSDSSIRVPVSFSSLLVNIDGPYGLSVTHDLHRYTHILLVGGGIGVTPLHSCLRHLYLNEVCAGDRMGSGRERREGGRSEDGRGERNGESGERVFDQYYDDTSLPLLYPNLVSVRLLWSVRSKEEASMFMPTVCIHIHIISFTHLILYHCIYNLSTYLPSQHILIFI